jgi:hypothetical protein
MNYGALSNAELAGFAEADRRYLVDPLYTELVHRLVSDESAPPDNDYHPISEKAEVAKLLTDKVDVWMIDRIVNILDEVAEAAQPFPEPPAPLLRTTSILGGPLVRAGAANGTR